MHCIRFDSDSIFNLRTTMLWTGQNSINYNEKSLTIEDLMPYKIILFLNTIGFLNTTGLAFGLI